MNNLKCLKQGFSNKYICRRTSKEIKLSDCKNCPYKEYKESNVKQIRQRTSKQAKLERGRFSLFTDDLEHCYFCKKSKDNIHEVIFGKNRVNSMKYGLTLPLCNYHHRLMHSDTNLINEYKRKGQVLFENTYPDLVFEDIFKINYL